jgi:hypothetical protein
MAYRIDCKPFFLLVEMNGIEPSTYALRTNKYSQFTSLQPFPSLFLLRFDPLDNMLYSRYLYD